MEVVPLKKYCEITGDTPNAIRTRIARGTWRYGEQVLKIRGIKQLHVDTAAADAWFRDPRNHEG